MNQKIVVSVFWILTLVAATLMGGIYLGPIIHSETKQLAVQPSNQRTSSSQDMVALINQLRSDHDLPPLVSNFRLNTAALNKACDMVERNYFGHLDPEGREVWHFIAAENYYHLFAGENLTEGYDSDQEALAALMESPRHRDNLLSEDFRDLGIGRCGDFQVQLFALPRLQ